MQRLFSMLLKYDRVKLDPSRNLPVYGYFKSGFIPAVSEAASPQLPEAVSSFQDLAK